MKAQPESINPFSLAVKLANKYWAQPQLWPAIWREGRGYILRKLRPALTEENRLRLARERESAREWCASKTVSTDELSRRLSIEYVHIDPWNEFPDVFTHASKRVERCPTKLGGAGNLVLLYSLVKACDARCIVETGVAYGWSSLAILLAIKGKKGANLYSVDLPYLTILNDEWIGITVPEELKSRWTLYRMADQEGLPRAIKAAGQIDIAHYDSDKSPGGRLFGYQKLWAALRPGGLLVSDDISDNLAFRNFAERVNRTPVVISDGGKFQGILVK